MISWLVEEEAGDSRSWGFSYQKEKKLKELALSSLPVPDHVSLPLCNVIHLALTKSYQGKTDKRKFLTAVLVAPADSSSGNQ